MNKCQDCRWCSWPTPYHHPERQETLPLTFKCQRRAPITTGGMMSSIQTVWPEVTAEDGCGEWEFAHLKFLEMREQEEAEEKKLQRPPSDVPHCRWS